MDIAECHPTRAFQLVEQAVEQGQLEVLKQFLKSGYVNIHTLKNPSGLTMLMVAAWKGQAHVVSFLLDQNVGLEIQDFEGKTALFFAAWAGHTEIVDLLLNRGANLFAISNQGVNPLLLSLQSGNKETVFRLLAAAMQHMSEAELNTYMSQNNLMDIMLEINQQLIACRKKLAEIFQPIVFGQSGELTISSEQMQQLCQQFPKWYACLIKQDLGCVCTMLFNMKLAEQEKQQQITMPATAPVAFLPAVAANNAQTAPAPFIPKRKADNDVDGDRGNKRQKKEEPMQF